MKEETKAVIDYIAKKVEIIVIAAILAGGTAIYNHVDARKTIWDETGPHLMDAHNEIYSNINTIRDLSERLNKLEKLYGGQYTNGTIITANTNYTITYNTNR